jgi:hypothetical protein
MAGSVKCRLGARTEACYRDPEGDRRQFGNGGLNHRIPLISYRGVRLRAVSAVVHRCHHAAKIPPVAQPLTLFLLFPVLAMLVFVGDSTEGITALEMAFAGTFSALFAAHFFLTLAHGNVRPFVLKTAIVGGFVACYGLLMASLNGVPLKAALVELFNFAFVLVFIPLASWVRDDKAWVRVLRLFIIAGAASSAFDIYRFTTAGDLLRMASLEFASIVYFIAFVLAIGVVLCRVQGMFWTALLSLPIFGVRVALSLNRAAIAIALLCAALCVLWNLRHRKVGIAGLVILAISASAAVWYAGEETVGLWMSRIESVDEGVDVRSVELEGALSAIDRHPLGAGFGAETDLLETRPVRYVHNSMLYLAWKLGPVGIALAGLLSWLLMREMWRGFFGNNPLRLAVVLATFSTFLYSLAQTYYMRPHTNLALGVLIGYLLYCQRPRHGSA